MTSLTVTHQRSRLRPTGLCAGDLTMNDFLREYLGMTGTKFGYVETRNA